MGRKIKWERRQFECLEEDRIADLLLEWRKENGKTVLDGIFCDNPRFRDLDNWDCEWSCWEELEDDDG